MNLIKNGMFFDLGLRTADYHKPEIVKDAILDIEEKFTLVVIYEHLDESLVLMKRKLCWELDDVLYLKKALIEIESSRMYTYHELQSLQKWSKADFSLYNYFNSTLWKKISYEENFHEELKHFRRKQKEMEEECWEYLHDKGTESRDLNNSSQRMNQYYCHKMSLSTARYLEYFRTKFVTNRH